MNSVVVTVQNESNTKDYTVNVTYYPHVDYVFTPDELTADETYGLSSDTVTITGGESVNVTSATADNEHITVEVNGNTLTVSCDDDTIFTEDAMPYTVTVTGFNGDNPASGSFEIVHS